jgi:hypothetical protein
MSDVPIVDIAHLALRAQADVHSWLKREPARDLDGVWRQWAQTRDDLVTVRENIAQRLLDHPEYPAWHRQVWRDDLSLRVRAMSVWAPVARQVVAGGRDAPRVAG